MNKLFGCFLIATFIFSSFYGYTGDTVSVVTLTGSIVKAHHTENVKKYKRKNCPVCKGKGWYISGDDITKVPCGYCEPEEGQSLPKTQTKDHPHMKVFKK